MQRYVAWLEQQGLADSTRTLYIGYIARFSEWLQDHGEKRLQPGLSWKIVRTYARTLPLTYASRNVFKCALRHYGLAHRWEDCPTWAVQVPKPKRGVYRGLDTDEEKERLLAAARTLGPEPYAAICGLYYQAFRRHEIAKLRWADIRNGRITGVGKGAIEFDRPLHEKFAEALLQLVPEGPWVFPGRTAAGHISNNQVWLWVRYAGERAGLGKVLPHMLRHTSIATYQDAVGSRAAMDHARHTTLKHLPRYTRTTAAREKKGMEAL